MFLDNCIQLEEELLPKKDKISITLDELKSKEFPADGKLYEVTKGDFVKTEPAEDAKTEKSCFDCFKSGKEENDNMRTMEQRWYLREGHHFGFDRKSEKKFGGVALPYFDEFGRGYCYDEDIEQLRVTEIAGFGKPYISSTGQKDLLFRNIQWYNENRKKDIKTSYEYVVMNDRHTKSQRPDKFKEPYSYHLNNIFCGFLNSQVTYQTDSTVFEIDNTNDPDLTEDIFTDLESQKVDVNRFSTNLSEVIMEEESQCTCNKYLYLKIMRTLLIFSTISLALYFLQRYFRSYFQPTRETSESRKGLVLLVFLMFISWKMLFDSSIETIRGRINFRIALKAQMFFGCVYLTYRIFYMIDKEKRKLCGESCIFKHNKAEFKEYQKAKLSWFKIIEIFFVRFHALWFALWMIINGITYAVNSYYSEQSDKLEYQKSLKKEGFKYYRWQSIEEYNQDKLDTAKRLDNLRISADFFKALFTFKIDDSEEGGLGQKELKEIRRNSSYDITADVVLKDEDDQSQNGRTILCGFEGFTDNKGEVAVIRTLLLEKRWVEKREKGFCEKHCKKPKELINYLVLIWNTVFSYACCRSRPCCNKCFKLDYDNIAENRDQKYQQPIDFVDHVWANKYDKMNVHSIKRDYLRFTFLGKCVHDFQYLRMVLLVYLSAYQLHDAYSAYWRGKGETPAVDQRGFYVAEYQKLRWLYLSGDFLLSLPIFMLVIQIMTQDYTTVSQSSELFFKAVKTITNNDKEFLIILFYEKLTSYCISANEKTQFGGFRQSNLLLVEYKDELQRLWLVLTISISISFIKKVVALVIYTFFQIFLRCKYDCCQYHRCSWSKCFCLCLFYDIYHLKFRKDRCFTGRLFCCTNQKEEILDVIEQERDWFEKYDQFSQVDERDLDDEKYLTLLKKLQIQTSSEERRSVEFLKKKMINARDQSKKLSDRYQKLIKDLDQQQESTKKMVEEDKLYKRYISFMGYWYHSLTEDYFMLQVQNKSSATQYIDEHSAMQASKTTAYSSLLRLSVDYFPQFYIMFRCNQLYSQLAGKQIDNTSDYFNKTKQQIPETFRKDFYKHYIDEEYYDFESLRFWRLVLFKFISFCGLLYTLWVSSFRWREKFIYNIKNYINDAINKEGVTMIDQQTQQTILKGNYFRSLGPEAFVQLIRTNAEAWQNQRIILRQPYRYGIKKQIKLIGDYKEWITYLAKYKLDLKSIHEFDTNEHKQSGSIMMGLHDDEYFQLGDDLKVIDLQPTSDTDWREFLIDKQILDIIKSFCRGDTRENSAKRVQTFIDQLNEDLAAIDLFKSSNPKIREQIKDKKIKHQFSIRVGVKQDKYNYQQNLLAKQKFDEDEFIETYLPNLKATVKALGQWTPSDGIKDEIPFELKKRPPQHLDGGSVYYGMWDFKRRTRTGLGCQQYSPQFAINDISFYVKGIFLNGQLHGQGKYYMRQNVSGQSIIVVKQGEFQYGALKNGIHAQQDLIKFADEDNQESFYDEYCKWGLYKCWDKKFLTYSHFNQDGQADNTQDQIDNDKDLWRKQYRIPIGLTTIFNRNNIWRIDQQTEKLANCLYLEDKSVLKKAFKKADSNKNKSLEKHEFSSFVHQIAEQYSKTHSIKVNFTEKQCERIFDQLCPIGDGLSFKAILEIDPQKLIPFGEQEIKKQKKLIREYSNYDLDEIKRQEIIKQDKMIKEYSKSELDEIEKTSAKIYPKFGAYYFGYFLNDQPVVSDGVTILQKTQMNFNFFSRPKDAIFANEKSRQSRNQGFGLIINQSQELQVAEIDNIGGLSPLDVQLELGQLGWYNQNKKVDCLENDQDYNNIHKPVLEQLLELVKQTYDEEMTQQIYEKHGQLYEQKFSFIKEAVKHSSLEILQIGTKETRFTINSSVLLFQKIAQDTQAILGIALKKPSNSECIEIIENLKGISDKEPGEEVTIGDIEVLQFYKEEFMKQEGVNVDERSVFRLL